MKALEIAGIFPEMKGSEMGRDMTKSGPEMQPFAGWQSAASQPLGDRPQVGYNSIT